MQKISGNYINCRMEIFLFQKGSKHPYTLSDVSESYDGAVEKVDDREDTKKSCK